MYIILLGFTMITVISSTNLTDNLTQRIARFYTDMLQEAGQESNLFSLEDLPPGFVYPNMYSEPDEKFKATIEKCLIKAERFVFIVPEYHGSIPGILKVLLDGCDVNACFAHKKACLVGVSGGRQGNLMGLDHLTSILHHINTNVYYDKVKISNYNQKIKDEAFDDPETQKRLKKQMEGFLEF